MPNSICKICKKPLYDYTSVILGMGPVCRAREKLQPYLDIFFPANFSVMEITEKYIYIKDCGGEARSVTNDAERVLSRLSEEYGIEKRRIFYMDSMGQIDEITHTADGRFTGFKYGHEGVQLCG